jgi:hypothetical protein
MNDKDTLEYLKSTDPDSYQEMCEIAATPIHEIEASLCESKLQLTAELHRELRRLVRPSPFRRLTVRVVGLGARTKDCLLLFFFMPARQLATFGLLVYFFAIPLMSTHSATQAGVLGQPPNEKCIRTVDGSGNPYRIPVSQRSVGRTLNLTMWGYD